MKTINKNQYNHQGAYHTGKHQSTQVRTSFVVLILQKQLYKLKNRVYNFVNDFKSTHEVHFKLKVRTFWQREKNDSVQKDRNDRERVKSDSHSVNRKKCFYSIDTLFLGGVYDSVYTFVGLRQVRTGRIFYCVPAYFEYSLFGTHFHRLVRSWLVLFSIENGSQALYSLFPTCKQSFNRLS
ncbi:MAG: hypothetical protein AB8B61_04490 [Cyclobacteriaceae bacterium]